MNVRIWKAQASEQLGTLLPRERHKAAYNKVLGALREARAAAGAAAATDAADVAPSKTYL